MAPFDTPRIKRRLGTVAVAGDSMAPTFSAGDWLVVLWGGAYRRGQVVLIERESQPGVFLIKRVVGPIEEKIWVEGDNKGASTDSRQWGAIDQGEIVATVLFRFLKAGSRRAQRRKN
jgi:nickel-type superoxide dismutase maturation protease